MNRTVRIAGPALLLVVAALVALLAALAFGGGSAAPLLNDPGPVVRFGLPVAKLAVNLGAAGMIGSLVLTLFALSPRAIAKRTGAPAEAEPRTEYTIALDVAAASAAFFAAASALTGFFTFLNVTQTPLSLDRDFGTKLSYFIGSIPVGQAWLITTLLAAVVTVLCFAVRNQTALVFVTAVALLTLLPMAQQGHAAGASGHDAAVTALGLHLVFAAIWLGGLLTIVALRPLLGGARLLPVLGRYSSLALVSFVVVAASGYISAELRLATLGNLLTGYGVLVLVKVAALTALGVFGLVQRRFLIARMRRAGGAGGRSFWWLVAAEIAFMGIASGVAAALARTATPVDQVTATELTNPTPAELLTGEALPPAPSALNFLTLWNVDLVWLLVCGFGIAFYVAGVVRLHRRGDRWPVHRTVLWIAGMLLLAYITNGGVNAYEKYLFSAHMLAHMVLTMAVPVLLVPAAPVTLIARAAARRTDGSRGGREWVLLAVHSRFATAISHPIVAALLFVGSLWGFYYSPLFRWATTDHIGHEWMIVHFLITGYLFVSVLIGVDPSVHRVPYPMRLLLLLGTMAFHAFFGLALMTGEGLLLADWYGAMGWGTNALDDQQAAGGIAWSIGEIPTLALAIIVAVMWSRSDARDSKRLDRQADRTGEAELTAYNDRLAALQKRG
ncbi:putative copper resistance protein D [Rathayibacter sp. PhB93]|uniref:cytochrome c oxidase assembly protein n=1 Tax=unclassified Rathayibacter TaxID=2609250 RepID=UPI000FB95BBD|nr:MULTISPECIES: cytochrome c oxidase assembly protein [unclassified Rathayibacter]ROQ15677.1 putative copper resistance protein D [Rathayibacter sp. PhB93]TDQ15616.1 putative copper resistance protein D [Rathayibacter sp. PhB1]